MNLTIDSSIASYPVKVQPNIPQELKLDWNPKFNSDLEFYGEGARYTPEKITITIKCSADTCTVNSEPNIISPDGTVNIKVEHVRDEQRIKNIAKEKAVNERREKIEAAANERREKKEAAARARAERGEQQRRHNQRINCAAFGRFRMTPMSLKFWLDNKCDELVR